MTDSNWLKKKYPSPSEKTFDEIYQYLTGFLIYRMQSFARPILNLQINYQDNNIYQCCASACKTSTTQNQPHQISNTQRTEKKTTDVVIELHSRKLLMMDILMS